MLNVVMPIVAIYIYDYAECRYAERRYAECLILFMIMLNVIMLNVIMLSIMASYLRYPHIMMILGSFVNFVASVFFCLKSN